MKTLIAVIAVTALSGCTLMVGSNEVGHLSPRGSYRSVDTSGDTSEGLMEMTSGGQVEAKATLSE